MRPDAGAVNQMVAPVCPKAARAGAGRRPHRWPATAGCRRGCEID